MSPGHDRGSILVLSAEEDVTANLVIDKLRADGEPVIRLDTRAFPAETRLSASYEDDGLDATLTWADGTTIDFSRIRSIWNRRPSIFAFPPGLSADTVRFAKAEARQALGGLLHAADCLWINPPQAEARARLKPLQLRVAQDVGLSIPASLISTSPDDVRDFVDRHGGNVVYKRLSGASLYDEQGLVTPGLTTKLTDELLSRLEQVTVTPCLFQENLPKVYELRVTVVGEFVQAARIDSQECTEARIDSRLAAATLPWTKYELPSDVADRLRALIAKLGLVFGAFDLVVTPDGRYVFLEVNPGGQWAWFDDDITLPIRDAIASALAAGSVPALAAEPHRSPGSLAVLDAVRRRLALGCHVADAAATSRQAAWGS